VADLFLISKITMAFSFSSVFWIDASSIGTITQGLKGICNLPTAQSSGLDGSPESALHWIGLLKENYVMVFDNADILSPAELEAYLPPGRGGNILITSRNSTMKNLTLPENSLEVTEMKEDDAIELLLKASCLDPFSVEFQAQALNIVKELSYLPLAIDQAGAYIASGATTIGDYLAKYSDHRKTLLSHSEFTGASKYNRSVYGTLELSYKEIQKRAKSNDSHKANAANSARFLLKLFPFFHHEGITEEIFSYAALQEDEETCNSKLPCASSLLDRRLLPLNKSGIWDNFVFREGLRVLLSFSLIKKGSSDGIYAMHPLVHAWGRDRLTLNKRTNCCLMAYITLSCSLRWDISQPYGFQRVLVTHLRVNMEYFKSDGSQNMVSYMDDAYAKFGRLLQEQGYFKQGETLLNKVLDTRKELLGVEHPDTITAMANLAAAYRDLGKYKEAEKLDIQVLDERNRILEAEHPDIINAMGNLAATYHEQGKYTEAEKLKIQVVEARNRFLGVEHPDTITAIATLALTYLELGKYTESEKLWIQVLDARNRILGVEHPETINTMGYLASIYHELGKHTEAEKLKIQVLDAKNRIFGEEHPETIRTIASLAATYHELGKYIEAERLKVQVLDTRNKILGVEHPVTINSMGNLAATYRKLEKYTEAEKLEIQVLDARNRILGVQHPDTIRAMANLTRTYRRLKKYTEAEKLDIQVLDARNRILGVEHPETIRAIAHLAATYHGLGKYTEAEKLEIQVLDARNRILGVEHPDTIRAMANLAATYHNMGRYPEAEKLKIQVLDVMNRILGVEHPDTIYAMRSLAATYQHLGKYIEAEKLDIQVLDATNPIVSTPWVIATPGTTTFQETVATIEESTQPSRKRRQPNFVPTMVTGKMPAAIGPDGRPLKKRYVFL
jgi:folate-binding Fe-S cluster repair protein YgfZ